MHKLINKLISLHLMKLKVYIVLVVKNRLSL
jgi:hypothetical protein